jgi:TolB-like protein/tRNA A-37 threonylcarbamoyl transferase component Bud32
MTPERWQAVAALVQDALDHTPGERGAFLDRECGDDGDLRADVDALLDAERGVGQFLEASALDDAGALLQEPDDGADTPMRIGAYMVERRLGSGGMGEVLLAEDMRLGRKVALKVLDPALTADRAARARFLREARLASSLDHPHVCTVYEVGDADGRLFIAMQHVPGQTLRQMCAGRPLAAGVLLPLALQVAAALAAAHARGIVHRDVKASNIMVTPEGRATVVDFGLATLLDRKDSGRGTDVTAAGIVLGTPASMSPEQARGGDVDHRSDIFSFGVVLYEMATGTMPFTGESHVDVVSALISATPVPVETINPAIPEHLCRLIDRALAKQPCDRHQSMGDLRAELHAIDADVARDAVPVTPMPPRRTGRWSGALLAALAVLVAGLAWVGVSQRPVDAPQVSVRRPLRSLAVLPFKPLVEGQRDEVLEFGMADMLITRLGAYAAIDVRPIGAVRRYTGLEQDARAAGVEQRVDAVIEGHIQRSGEQVRVTVRMTSVADGRQLWSEQFDEPFTDVFALQDAISLRIAGALAVPLSSGAAAARPRRPTGNAEAYHAYLRGRYHLTRLNDDGFTTALQHFRTAAQLDPTSALAQAGIADAYLALSSFNAIASREGLPKARAAAEQALALDGGLAEARVALAGAIFLHDWDWSAADAEYRRALALGPGVADAHLAYGMFLAAMGHTKDALGESMRALELDPLSPATISGVAYVLQMARRPGEAESRYREALELNPDFSYGRWGLGRVLSEQHLHQQAAVELQRAITLSNGSPDEIAELARADANAGHTTSARAGLARLRTLARARYVSPTTMACVYASLGDRDSAFAWLQRAHRERDFLLVTLKVEPMFDPIRGDPRFTVLLQRMQLWQVVPVSGS